MAKIYSLSIKNFRGIESFEDIFGDASLVCLIGRGDSGKSTILEAISLVLSPSWNISLNDSDFYNCKTENSIEIEATLSDFPPKFLSEEKFGLFLRGIDPISGEIKDELNDDLHRALTIRLTIKKDLEPKWEIVNDSRSISISAHDRSLLNVFMISDYLDRHFSWNRGNPLYSLLSKVGTAGEEDENPVVDALRSAKVAIDAHPFSEFDSALLKVQLSAKSLGIDISGVETTMDVRDLLMKDGKVSLHGEKIPFRLKGKGSKRLVSIAIQTALIEDGGIMLIDELEQGLEPDRTQHLVQTLKESSNGQVFITTHSRDVLVELDAEDLFLIRKGADKLTRFKPDLQGCLRKNPEAFFSTKVLVCEGPTEIGVCQALNSFKISRGHQNAALAGVRFANGEGSKIVEYCGAFNTSGFSPCLFCDSDTDKRDKVLTSGKEKMQTMGITVVDWDEGDCLEVSIVKYLPLVAVQDLLQMAAYFESEKNSASEEENLGRMWDSIKARYGSDSPESITSETDSPKLRVAIGLAANKGSWFKSQTKGEALGTLVFKYWDDLEQNRLRKNLSELSVYIDGNGL